MRRKFLTLKLQKEYGPEHIARSTACLDSPLRIRPVSQFTLSKSNEANRSDATIERNGAESSFQKWAQLCTSCEMPP